MTAGFAKYLRNLFLYSLLVGAAAWGLSTIVPEKFRPVNTELGGLFAFFFLTTALLHYYLQKAGQGRPQGFVRAFTGAFALKIFLYFILLLSYALINRQGLLRFASAFLFLYSCFLIYEAIALLNYFKKQNPAQT